MKTKFGIGDKVVIVVTSFNGLTSPAMNKVLHNNVCVISKITLRPPINQGLPIYQLLSGMASGLAHENEITLATPLAIAIYLEKV